jgi:O-antigen/teichoic acid export membrane protein
VTVGADTPDAGLGKRVLAFAGLPFLSLITPFLFLPILARVAGPDAWVAIAVGQSIGAFVALSISFGYNTVGPALVALAPIGERSRLLATSIRVRSIILVPGAIVAAVLAALIAPESNRLDAAVMALAMTLSGLSSSWFMIGLGRASLIAIYEILPRIVATLAAVPFLVVLGQVIWYPALLVVASVVSVSTFALRTVGLRGLVEREPGEFRLTWLHNRAAVTTEVASGAYNSLAVTFVSLVAPAAQTARYVSGDKLYRIGQYSVSALGNALQGWVVEDARLHFTRRARRSFLMHFALGFAGLVAFITIGPWLSGFLFGDAVAIDVATAAGFGFATLFIALGTTLGRITLVGLGARREFMVSVLLGAAAGIPAVLILASQFGAAGGAWGLAVGEFVSVTAQSILVVRTLKASARKVA